METPQAIVSLVPPSSWYKGMRRICASTSQTAFSRAALAMRWPRTLRKMLGHPPPGSLFGSREQRRQLMQQGNPRCIR